MFINKTAALHTSQIKVRFYDTDLSSVVFFTNYQKWFDSIALIEFLEGLGISLKKLHNEGLDMTLVSTAFSYKVSLTVDDLADVSIEEIKVGSKSLQFSGSVYKHDTGELVAGGQAVYVFVDRKTHKAIYIPEKIKKILSKQNT
jgi:YbgC/YbaW family acyl-CoA thioester hydrolase